MSQRPVKVQPDPESSRKENERQYHVLNQMLTSHSMMRDRYSRRSMALRMCMFCSAVAVGGFAFVDEKLFKIVGLTPESVKLAVGIASLFVLTLSVVELLVGWERKAVHHEEAAKRLAAMKLRYRKAHTKYGGNTARINEGLTKEWEKLNESLPSIPDQLFVRLKHSHHIKRQLSELAESNRQVPYTFLVASFYARGMWKAMWGGLTPPPRGKHEELKSSANTTSLQDSSGDINRTQDAQ